MRTLLIGLLLLTTPILASDITKVDINGNKVVKKYTIKKINSDKVAMLHGEVRQWNVDIVKDKLKELANESNKVAYLDIDSPGGSIRAGINLIKTIQGLKDVKGLQTHCVVTGAAYSMAGVIASYCHKTYMTFGSDMMFHGASYSVGGNADEVFLRVLFITNWLRELEAELAHQMGITLLQFLKIRGRELWLTSNQAVRRGFADGILINFYHEAIPPELPGFDFSFSAGEGIDFDYITYIPSIETGSNDVTQD